MVPISFNVKFVCFFKTFFDQKMAFKAGFDHRNEVTYCSDENSARSSTHLLNVDERRHLMIVSNRYETRKIFAFLSSWLRITGKWQIVDKQISCLESSCFHRPKQKWIRPLSFPTVSVKDTRRYSKSLHSNSTQHFERRITIHTIVMSQGQRKSVNNTTMMSLLGSSMIDYYCQTFLVASSMSFIINSGSLVIWVVGTR